MPWQVGIDEAGYGPNLGPFVMSIVACRVPTPDVDLWEEMDEVVRRPGDKDVGRLLVADSKVVFSPGKGLRCLESAVLAFLCGGGHVAVKDIGFCVTDLVGALAGASLGEL